jgi:hypothetical protein
MLSTLEATRSIIHAAELEARRLKDVLAQFKAANEASLRFLESARKMANGPYIKIGAISDPGIWLERADQAFALAEEVHDPGIRRLLFEMAKSYDELANSAAFPPGVGGAPRS